MGLLDFFRKDGCNHEKVGTLIQTELFGCIIITRFISDSHWYFKTYNLRTNKAQGKEEKSKTKYTHYLLNDKVLKVGK